MNDEKLDSKSRRLSRVEKSLREVLGQHMSANLQLFEGALVTVVRVSCSPDLRNAEAFISVYGGPSEDPAENEDIVFDVLDEQRTMMQHKISKELPMKFCPKLKFTLDGSIDKLVHFSEILNEEKRIKPED